MDKGGWGVQTGSQVIAFPPLIVGQKQKSRYHFTASHGWELTAMHSILEVFTAIAPHDIMLHPYLYITYLDVGGYQFGRLVYPLDRNMRVARANGAMGARLCVHDSQYLHFYESTKIMGDVPGSQREDTYP